MGSAARMHPTEARTDCDRRALVWRRIFARAIDLATVAAALWVLVVVRVLWFMNDAATAVASSSHWGRALAPLLAYVVALAVYEVAFLSWSDGQTPGKDLMDVRVVTARNHGAVGPGRALRRWAAVGPALLFPLPWCVSFAVVGTALSAVGPRRSLPDLVAGTEVIPWVRDLEDEAARRPVSRRHRIRRAEAESRGEQ